MRSINRVMLAFGLISSMSVAAVQTLAAGVPFKGTGNAQITSVQPGPAGVSMTAAATGHSTQLGDYNRVESILVGPDGSFTGDVTFTAANGDQLNGKIAGAFTSAATAAGSYSFIGGTGRFANATGTAYFVVSLMDPVHFSVAFNGSLEN
jgi:hypothetical protein